VKPQPGYLTAGSYSPDELDFLWITRRRVGTPSRTPAQGEPYIISDRTFAALVMVSFEKTIRFIRPFCCVAEIGAKWPHDGKGSVAYDYRQGRAALGGRVSRVICPTAC
jgi:hypothetical protein